MDNTGNQLPDQETDSTTLTRRRTSSGKLRTPNVCHCDYQIYLANVIDYHWLHQYQLAQQDRMSNPITFMAEMIGDIMYFHQAMKQRDADEFCKAIMKEINGHVQNDNREMIPQSQVPPDQEVVPSVWAMRRNQDITTNEITEYKARLNVHGGKQTFSLNYYKTYSQVVT